MGAYQLTATIASTNGLPEDAVVYTANIIGDVTFIPESEYGQLTTAMNSFFNVSPAPGVEPLCEYLGAGLSRSAGGIHYRLYDLTGHLDGSPHGSPVAEDFGTLGASVGGGAIPDEVAFVVTLRALGWQDQAVETPDGADPGTEIDRPRSRYTGRMFIGPLSAGVMTTVAGRSRPSSLFRSSARNAVKKFTQDLGVNGHLLAVWSRKNLVMLPVTHIEDDDAWDTQRRRGVSATGRTLTTL